MTAGVLAERFERQRGHLRGLAYRMLGSFGEAEDAVQEAWLRLQRARADEIDNLGGWLTTAVGRICLNLLRSRATRGEEPLDGRVPDPAVAGPEDEAVLADSVGLALLVVLDAVPPAERVAFVLHDMFAVPFDEIGPIVGRSAVAARQLASRARRRVRAAPVPDRDLARQRAVVEAFFGAARDGDFDALVALLDPDVVLRSDAGARATTVLRGPSAVAGSALMFAAQDRVVRPVLVNGAAGAVIVVAGRPTAVMGFTVRDGRILAVDALADPDRLALLDLGALRPPGGP